MAACRNCGKEVDPDARFCASCGAQVETAVEGRRKTVTLLFSDVVDSTGLVERLDAETHRRRMSRWFETARDVVERYGGVVEKFVGDEVMAVFGVPVAHEDDALRAVLAATAMQQELDRLNAELGSNLQTRTALSTGEVVTGDPASGQTFVTGAAVVVAKRLETAAAPGQILLGPDTHRLVRHAVQAERLAPLSVKGVEQPVAPFRLFDVRVGVGRPEGQLRSPMVGRSAELARLRTTFAESVASRTCRLLTVVGEAGVGKSRLVSEFVEDVAHEATLLRGRCPPHGERITFWPVLETLRQALGLAGDEDEDDVRARIRARLEPQPEEIDVTSRLLAVLGFGGPDPPPEETAWAVRRLFESLARERPLVVVLDDLQWGAEAFLDLVENAAVLSRDAPLLIVSMARPELLERRAGWAADGLVALEPLPANAGETLIANLLGSAAVDATLSRRLLDASGGNPLFVEELLAMLLEQRAVERRGGRWTIATTAEIAAPESLGALLAARLDQLSEEERSVLEAAAVEGEVFHAGAVQALMPEIAVPTLIRLTRRGLVRPESATVPGEEGFRFRHILIRDAAYASAPKQRRAQLHERYADWLAAKDAGANALIGHHLERAYRLRAELGEFDSHARELAVRAGRHLATAGTRASLQGDVGAAHALLAPAAELLPRDDLVRAEVLYELSECLLAIGGGEHARAKQTFTDALELAVSHGPSDLEGLLRVEEVLWSDDAVGDERERRLRELLPRLHAARNDRALGIAYLALAWVAHDRGQIAIAERLGEQAVEYASAANDDRTGVFAVGMFGEMMNQGPQPITELLARYEALYEGVSERHRESTLNMEAVALAWIGRFAEARQRLAHARAVYEDFGQMDAVLGWCVQAARIEYVAGNVRASERLWREGFERWGRAVNPNATYVRYQAAWLAELLCEEGRYDEAAAFVAAAEGAPKFPVEWHIPCARACLLAGRGEGAEAERLAHEAVALADRTDAVIERGLMRLRLAQVLRVAGKAEDASAALEEATALFEQKGATAWVAFVDRLERAAVA